MAGPEWALWAFAVLAVIIGGFSAVQLCEVSPGSHDAGARRAAAVDHLLLAAGMTAMFLSGAAVAGSGVWIVVFVGQIGWLLRRLVRASNAKAPGTFSPPGSHLVLHLVAAAILVLAFSVVPSGSAPEPSTSPAGHLGAAGPAFTTVGWLAAAYFLAHFVWCGVRSVAPTTEDDRTVPLVMSLGMAYLVVTML